MVHLEKIFLVIYSLVKLQNKLYPLKKILEHLLDRCFHSIRQRLEEKGLRFQVSLKTSKADSIRYQGLRIIPCDSVSYSVSSLGPLGCSLSLSALRKTVISGCFIHGSTLRVLYCILSLTLSSQAGNVSSCIILKIMSVF